MFNSPGIGPRRIGWINAVTARKRRFCFQFADGVAPMHAGNREPGTTRTYEAHVPTTRPSTGSFSSMKVTKIEKHNRNQYFIFVIKTLECKPVQQRKKLFVN